jgi:undecaprenyl diphosphate synthase
MTPSHENFADGLHLAVIMDGNGRWARARGLPRTAGHREGALAVRRVIEVAPSLGVGTLTLYAFSSDNWRRPALEVAALMRLFHRHLRTEAAELAARGVRLTLIGRRDRLPARVRAAAAAAEEATRAGTRLHLRLAVDYSSRDVLAAAAERLRGSGQPVDRDTLGEALRGTLGDAAVADVDLLVRTSGEQRLSDFMLWESAYAEILFAPVLWPDVEKGEVGRWIAEFRGRDRRFGGIVAEQAAAGWAVG